MKKLNDYPIFDVDICTQNGNKCQHCPSCNFKREKTVQITWNGNKHVVNLGTVTGMLDCIYLQDCIFFIKSKNIAFLI
jgi:hypothetical protein